MPPISYLLEVYFLPAVLVALILGAIQRLCAACCRAGSNNASTSHPASPLPVSILAPPILAAALALGIGILGGFPNRPPGEGDAFYWIFWFLIPLGVLGLIDATLSIRPEIRVGAIFIGARIALQLLVAPLVGHIHVAATAPRMMWDFRLGVDAGAAAFTLFVILLEEVGRRSRGIAPIALGIISVAAAVVLGLNLNVKAAQSVGVITAISAAVLFLTLIFRDISLDRAAALVLGGTLAALVAFGHFFAPQDASVMTIISELLLAASPAALFAGDLPGLRRMGGISRLTIRIIALLLVLGLAIGLAVAQAQSGGGSMGD